MEVQVQQEAQKAQLQEAAAALQAHLEGFMLEHPSIKYYYYSVGTDADRNGPVHFDELVAQYKKGVVHLETYIWHKLMGDKWIKLKNNG
jgi:hypothetical protein